MSARALNTSPTGRVAAAGATLLVLVASLASGGCGSSSQDANAVLRQAFHPSKPISSGKVDLAFGLTATGLATVRQPFSLRVQGPFQSQGSGQLPRFALSVTLNSSGRPVSVGATATGSQLFLMLQGVPFVAPDSVYQQFKQGYAQSAAAQRSKGQATFASLGLDPRSWLANPRVAGTATVDGVRTVRVLSGLDVGRFLNDLGRVSSTGNNLGLGAGLSAAQRTALAQSVKAARVEVYAGRDDHVLRRLTVHATLVTPPAAKAALGGLSTGTLDLTLDFSDVNQPQTISAPANAQPLSKLTGLLSQLGVAGTGSGAGGAASAPTGSTATGGATATAPAGGPSTGTSSTPAPAPTASGQQAYLQCASRAGQNVAALQRCAPLLSGG